MTGRPKRGSSKQPSYAVQRRVRDNKWRALRNSKSIGDYATLEAARAAIARDKAKRG